MDPATVLIVDDEPQIRRTLLTVLASQGYSVIQAKTGDEALEKLREEVPDLIASGRQHARTVGCRDLPRNSRRQRHTHHHADGAKC